MRLRRLGYEQGGPSKVIFVPDPTAWTEVPESWGVLGRQRDRWHRGLTDTLWRHRRLIGNPRFGAMGLVVFPYFVLVELLAPVVEALVDLQRQAAELNGLAVALAKEAVKPVQDTMVKSFTDFSKTLAA